MSIPTVSFSSGMISQNSGIHRGRIGYAISLLNLTPIETWGRMRLYSHEQAQQIIAKAREIDRYPNGRPAYAGTAHLQQQESTVA